VSRDQKAAKRNGFRFAPELLEIRNKVIVELSRRGFEWLSHYSAVDPMHDVYGIEVCGIREKRDAESILEILREMHPTWKPKRVWYKDYGLEQGWKAELQRDDDLPDETWETA
jgi:hypothetical protein